jgi:2-aminoadipate transaminase
LRNRTHFLNSMAAVPIDYNLGAGVPPLNLYPPLNLSELVGLFSVESNDKTINYHETGGYITSTAQNFIEVTENIDFEINNIIITNGVQEAISLAIACFKNEQFACIEPSYPGFEDAALSFGCKPIKLSAENWLNEIEKLPENALLYLSADFSNPTGKSLTFEERLRLLKIAESKKFYIFDDATYRPFNLEDAKPSLISLNKERVIHAISFSKILAPGLRTAFVYLPDSLKSSFVGHKSNLSLNNSGITQKIIKEWLNHQKFSLDKQLYLIKERLNRNKRILKSHGIDYFGGFFCLLKLDRVVDYYFCETLLIRKKIAIIPMILFSDDPKYLNQARICVANIDENDLEFVLNEIRKFEP